MKTTSPLIRNLKYFSKREKYSEGHSELSPFDREMEKTYRRRWQHDKVVRSTHGVNCTGSCSWKVYVKDGLITWETQQVDYPSTGPDMPEYEPRGCPRGASFSWYIYSPLRVKYPYIRAPLLSLWKEALRQEKDPVQAYKSIVEDPKKTQEYKPFRGKGGFIRASWDDINTLIAASLIYTIQKYGPDRIVGFSPIPAMSMVSHAAGSRFLTLIGAPMLSFYDWYADLPPASPQIWGDQTDVPESADWFNSGYLLVWGSNVPQTRTPDAHFLVEARYRGTKVAAVSPDYAEYVKFADTWLPVNVGMDAALAMAMTHVILKEFYLDNETPYFLDYVKKYTDLPFLVTLKPQGQAYVADRFLLASDLNLPLDKGEWKPVLLNQDLTPAIPKGSIGHRYDGKKNWNLHLEDENNNKIEPLLSILDHHDELVDLSLPYFGIDERSVIQRQIPVKKIDKYYVTTVYDLLLANLGLSRSLGGDYPANYDDPKPYTPAWQEAITGVKKDLVIKVAREFAENAKRTKGKSMIIMGAGINHWYHGDLIYRAILNLVLLTGSQGVNGGGWAHYVGQEKVRPLEGWQTVAMARDWGGPPRLQNGTSYLYFASDQWRYEHLPVSELVSPLYEKPRYQHYADYNVLAARLGWLPAYPQFNKNTLELYEEAQKQGAKTDQEVVEHLVSQLQNQQLDFAMADPDDPQNFPRVMFIWRANLVPSSGKGHEYILKHLLGTDHGVLAEEEGNVKTEEINWREEIPQGKLDLLINLDFRMTGTALYSDIILPAATWYEKYDISSTDMHPFIHPFNPAIAPPWEARSDWDAFKELAKTFSKLAETSLPGTKKDIVTIPLLHDSPGEISQPYGKISDWKKEKTKPVPGQNLPQIQIVNREYPKTYAKMITLGPTIKQQIGAKGLAFAAEAEYEKLRDLLGNSKEMPEHVSIFTDRDVVETILTLSSTTNGSLAIKAWKALEEKTGQDLRKLAMGREEEHLSLHDITTQPRKVISSPMYSGSETGNRRYSPFTTNVEGLIPWRTLTGRQHFYLDHEMLFEFGEPLALFKPTLPNQPFNENDTIPKSTGKELTLKYLTPHFKWSYHSTYGDTLPMLTLFRGGPHVWLNDQDAKEIDIADNDWIEVFNRYGAVIARAVVSHRLPRGIVFMYHSQDRNINIPISNLTGKRGGSHNSPTKVYLKPTHMIGGYAQLSYGFNYYGPTGNQRDLTVLVRKATEVNWHEN